MKNDKELLTLMTVIKQKMMTFGWMIFEVDGYESSYKIIKKNKYDSLSSVRSALVLSLVSHFQINDRSK